MSVVFLFRIAVRVAALLVVLASAAPGLASAASLQWTSSGVAEPSSLLVSASCPSVTFCAALGADGQFATRDGAAWSRPAPSGIVQGGESISCAESSFCAAVSQAGLASVYDGAGWSTPVQIDGGTGSALPAARRANAVSCPSSSFCVAVDLAGHVTVWNGETWSAPEAVDGTGLAAVSCPSQSFCVAVDTAGRFTAFDGRAWSAPSSLGMSTASSVACAGATFCAAVDTSGDAVTWNGVSWSAPRRIIVVGQGHLVSVTCPSASFCIAMDDQGDAIGYDGVGWNVTRGMDRPADATTAVSCASPTFCEAVDGQGNGLSLTATGWSMQAIAGGRPEAVSCASAAFCAVVDQIGDAASFDGRRWGAPVKVDRRATFSAVSCVSRTFCMAGGNGRVTAYAPAGWQTPRLLDRRAGLGEPTSVSCASRVFCMMTTADGWATYDGVRWSRFIRGRTPNTIACGSAGMCVGANPVDDGSLATFDGRTWRPAASSDHREVTAISCASATFCAAVDVVGRAMVFNGQAWSRPHRIDEQGSPTAISCPSRAFCVVGDWHGHVLTYNGRRWGPPVKVAASLIVGISCPAPTFCEAIDEAGDSHTAAGSVSTASTRSAYPIRAARNQGSAEVRPDDR